MSLQLKQIQEHLYLKQFEQAEKLIYALIQKDATSADAYYFLGVLNYFQGKPSQTLESLKKALKLNPKHTDAAICLSVLLNDIGKYDDAKKVFDQANQSIVHKRAGEDSEIDKKFSAKHIETGDLYFRYRRFDDAIEEYSKAIFLEPSRLETRIKRAKAYAKKGFLTRAMQELHFLKSENTNYIPARIQLGLLHYSQGNILDAEIEWEAAMHMDAENIEAISYLEMAKQSRLKPPTP
ncbi:MAG: tetratricopeptide repeat protein [Bdellovibrio sp.]|nr:tetratricopeptide repeat protein [Bdellovibrio sp.]